MDPTLSATKVPGEAINVLEPCLPELRDIHAEAIDPEQIMLHIGSCWRLFVDVRQRPDYPAGYHDGFTVANARLVNGHNYDEVGQLWLAAKANGSDPVEFFNQHFSTEDTRVAVRDAFPGESIDDYMDYMAGTALRRRIDDSGIYLGLPNLADAPGSRFIGSFPADNAVVALGKLARGDILGARDTIDNDVYLINRLGGLLPNWNGLASLDRSHLEFLSYAVEGLAAKYGDRGEEVIKHYEQSLALHADWWMRGRQILTHVTHDDGDAIGRQILLPGKEHDIVFRFNSDAPMDYDSKLGLRLESLFEDHETVERVLQGLTGEARQRRYAEFMRHILAACESTMDFAPGWQSADYLTLEQIRTTDIAPVFLQANMVHLLRLSGREEEARKLADIINRRMWRDTSPTHGQYGDLLRDGTQTRALSAVMAYPLMVGGIVPYDRAVKLANTWRDELLREHGFMISNADTNQQWDGSPGKENRGWPSVNMWLVECFTMAAIEARMNGQDPEPLLEVAEIARQGFLKGVQAWFDVHHNIPEKLNMVFPTLFVNGGEYAKKLEDIQKGFGMSIGAYRALRDRDLRAEVYGPEQHSWRQYTVRRLSQLALAA